MVVFPNPKINLGLNIVSRRSDGYHNIETIFYPVTSILDVLEIVVAPKGSPTTLTVTGNAIDCPVEKNLVMRAYSLLNQIHSLPNVDIHLHKRIPDGAGLGGGSADAAFMLKALNELFQLGHTQSELSALASTLGADCAFFIYNRPMLGTGIGNDLTPVDVDLSDYEIRMEKPDVSISTKEAYSNVLPAYPEVPLNEIIKRPVEEWRDDLKNDFERSVFPLHPEIAKIKQRNYELGAVYSSMSGSGSAVFGIFKNN